ncbi:cytochrome C oxidase subunit IV family protein [Thermoactinomyces intermedius]|uniref:Cytochrome C oxidase subunit IV family protein n=1 Tax=Thermoactinomyces intermedius TaxID=2024 RepID=A0A8I1A8R5_THEIN|nr:MULTISPECIES: cytochrome C oxidase subunit IV family protein [Thermoactinomyces]MBA4548106.1 cytochrome C oxidase subunit IV family protein [Thermoactinomyces intermedius]MBA4835330.1 cytochrome C oxidase subunit IV family protein [Thermoactinomyces intermedius]MBH8594950.1 cytochrome C oxidase subunit IV family protein [Thermoactinomyces intermedius]MBH8600390.1 cytochrome C oxidase subunit IV family protein [Thermoactinomyces sp. CICC 23799]
MKTQLQNEVKPVRQKSDTAFKHVVSFLFMIALTAVSFLAVINQWFSLQGTLFVIVFLAAVQVILQLYIFMHLDQKGYGMMRIFIFFGLLCGTVCAVGILLM